MRVCMHTGTDGHEHVVDVEFVVASDYQGESAHVCVCMCVGMHVCMDGHEHVVGSLEMSDTMTAKLRICICIYIHLYMCVCVHLC